MATKPIEILIEAKTTGDAEINALNKQLDDLSSQQELIANFVKVKKETEEAAAAFAAAQANAQKLGRELAATSNPTKTQAAEFARARDAVNGTKDAYQSAQLKLQGLRGALKENNIETTGLAQKQAALRKGVSEVEASVASASARLKEMGGAGQKAGIDTAQATDRASNSTKIYQGALKEIAGAVAGAFAVGKVVDFAKSVGEISDQYKNLQARVQLVTGEGDNFANAWQGVTDVALRTHSALEETGVLFTRLVQAGKDAGMSTAAATEQSLALTETINQAIQLSGASAGASSAAITQLVQGLQGGVLRGDEFNSIMEQSPRLARALADGLGVTTGELRKMAEAGALTSETVIGALKGQSDAVSSEFSKLPPTVGRALQDLSTQWTLYVAETDKATGASTAAASVINALAGNLNTIAGLLIDAGQAAAGFAALQLAKHFLGIGAAAQQAAVAVAAHNVQMAATGAAGSAAAVGAGRFASILHGLRTFTLIGLAVNFKDIGTWIGETTAKLVGYKDRTEELARADKLAADIAKEAASDRARLAAAIQTAIDKQFELSKAARAGVAEFEKLTKEGASSAEALKKVAAAFDLSNVQGIKDFSATLDKLTADGKVSASEIEKAWAQALSGKDLAQFEVMARAAFSGSAREGERVAQMMDGILRESVKRTGLDFDGLQGKIGAASRSALNDLEAIIGGLDRLEAQGVDTGRVLAASITKAIDTADGQKAIDAVIARIESMRKQLGDKVTDGLLDQAKQKAQELGDALDKAKPGINSVAEAMKALGITSSAALAEAAAKAKDSYDIIKTSGTATARDIGEAFKVAADRAIAANNGIAPSWVSAEAAARGYRIEVDAAGKATIVSMDSAKGAVTAVGKAVIDVSAALKQMGIDAATASQEVKDLAAAGQMLAAADLARKQAYNKDLEASKFMNRGNTASQDLVPTFNSLAEADAWREEWTKQYFKENNNVFRTGGQLGTYMKDLTMFEFEAEKNALALRDAMKNANGGTTPTSTTRTPTAGTNTTTVNISLNGTTRAINTDAAGADALQELLRQLASGKSVN